MGKKLINYALLSIVITIVTTIGSYTCKGQDSDTQTVIVQHPDGCFLLDPKPLTGISEAGDVVNVKPGQVKFEFDCNGQDYKVQREIKEGDFTVRIDPQL